MLVALVLVGLAMAIDEEVSQERLAAEAADKKEQIETFHTVDGR